MCCLSLVSVAIPLKHQDVSLLVHVLAICLHLNECLRQMIALRTKVKWVASCGR